MKSTPIIPSDNQIRGLLESARRSRDPRTTVAIGFVLAFGCTLAELRILPWHDLDWRAWRVIIRDPKTGAMRVGQLTELLGRQITAIRDVSRHTRVFAKPTPQALRLGVLLRQALDNAGLHQTRIEDLVSWSTQQSASTRANVVTAA